MSAFVEMLTQVEVPGDPESSAAALVKALRLSKPQAAVLLDLIVDACRRDAGNHARAQRDLGAEWLEREWRQRPRDLYLTARDKVATRTHRRECDRCSFAGRPAAPGSSWSPRHQHAYALSVVNRQLGLDRYFAREAVLHPEIAARFLVCEAGVWRPRNEDELAPEDRTYSDGDVVLTQRARALLAEIGAS